MFDIDKQVAKFTDFVPFENYEDYKKLSSEDKKEYNYQLKIYRDWRNIIQTAYNDGVKKGVLKSQIIIALERNELTVNEIAQGFEVSIDFVLKIKKENEL
jgi:hypothetical protein